MNTCSNGSCNELFQISNVIISNNTIIPPCSTVQPRSLSTTLGNCVVELWDSDMAFIMPRSLHSKGSKPILCHVNVSDKHLKLKQGHAIGIATEIQEGIIIKQHCENVSVQKITPSKKVHEILEHLQELLTKSGEHLSPQEKVLLQDVLLS